jgi:lactoylglutathione lyase
MGTGRRIPPAGDERRAVKIQAFLHAKLDVADLARSEHFYADLLGLVEIVRYEIPGGTILQLSPTGRSPGVELWYEASRPVAEPTACHIAFDVDDTRGWVERLRREGIDIAREPFDVGDETIAFVRDPDGYLVELNQTRVSGSPGG